MVKGRVLASFHPTGTQAMVTVKVTEMCEPAWRTIQSQEGTMVSKTDSGAGGHMFKSLICYLGAVQPWAIT